MGMPSLQIECFDPATNERRLRESLDLLSEVRDAARLRTVAYQQRVARYYNKRVKARPLEVGDLVLRSVEAAGKTAKWNKLSPGWEGPFFVSAILRSGAYKLRAQNGKLTAPKSGGQAFVRKTSPWLKRLAVQSRPSQDSALTPDGLGTALLTMAPRQKAPAATQKLSPVLVSSEASSRRLGQVIQVIHSKRLYANDPRGQNVRPGGSPSPHNAANKTLGGKESQACGDLL
ncbi:hypothetical protein Nepgr_031454 [Nepenthes gracilis]|uniref:Uncharacterized protein n=1 Tax=Nepenthes gracilis TaxID=150966 RepID=A0AAD3Y7J0_NEPGR|nr:hypothetical protein Nepgr_031454 [Nepenthes gracilis]